MDLYTAIGLAGVVVYVAAYASLQLGMLDGNGLIYSVANVIAAALVLVSLTNDFNLASAAIQVIWITFGVAGLGLRAFRRRVDSDHKPINSATPVGSVSPLAPARHVQTSFRLRPDGPPVVGRTTLGLQADIAPVSENALSG